MTDPTEIAQRQVDASWNASFDTPYKQSIRRAAEEVNDMAAQVKLNSGVFVEIDVDEDLGCVTIESPLLGEQISPNEARIIGDALIRAANQLDPVKV